jgi:hypothetical protein
MKIEEAMSWAQSANNAGSPATVLHYEIVVLRRELEDEKAMTAKEKGRADDNYKVWHRLAAQIEEVKEERDDLKARLAQHEGPL